MKEKSFLERLLEVQDEFELPKGLLEYANGGYEYDTFLTSVEKFSDSEGLVPVVFYRKSDGRVENLGVSDFLCGKKIHNYVGRVIEKYRKGLRLTQQQLADKVAVSHVNIYRYESGKSRPTIPMLERISRALGLVPAYMLEPKKAEILNSG